MSSARTETHLQTPTLVVIVYAGCRGASCGLLHYIISRSEGGK